MVFTRGPRPPTRPPRPANSFDLGTISMAAETSFVMCAAAPAKFLGNKGAVFGGLLMYKLGFFEYNSENEDFIHDFDVVLARYPS
jgi:hypothetical protein